MESIYISGKITGLDIGEAAINFQNAESHLIQTYDNIEVINPIRSVPYKKGKTWEEYMIDDIALLFECDTIYMLKNWTDSKGARIECAIAMNMGKTILFE